MPLVHSSWRQEKGTVLADFHEQLYEHVPMEEIQKMCELIYCQQYEQHGREAQTNSDVNSCATESTFWNGAWSHILKRIQPLLG